MSAIKLVYLYCDGEDCTRSEGNAFEPFSVDPLPGENASFQRARAKTCGWIRRGRKDYCGVCAPRYVHGEKP